jgi:hypothetical protein
VRPAGGGQPAQLGRISSVRLDDGTPIVELVRVPSNALSTTRYVVRGSRRLPALAVRVAGAMPNVARSAVETGGTCSDVTGSIGGSLTFSASASGSLGVTWVRVWGPVYAPEISGGVSLSPGLSLTLSSWGFSGSCEVNFNSPTFELASVDTFAGPLSLCFDAGGSVGAQISGMLDQQLSASLTGSIGTNFHFGFAGAGLNPFLTVKASASSYAYTSFSGYVYVNGGPALLAEWGLCDDFGAGVQAQLLDEFDLGGNSSGWYATVKTYVNAAVNLNLLSYTYDATIQNFDIATVQIASGPWPGGGPPGCGIAGRAPQVIC